MRLGTDEDLLKRFGSGNLHIGFPVRPPGYQSPSKADERPADQGPADERPDEGEEQQPERG